jgi:hypothetical protein
MTLVAGAKKRKCESFAVFETNVDRSRAFIRVFDGRHRSRSRGRPTNDEAELLRGALVFAVGALDNFMHELILELVPKFGGDGEAMRRPLVEISKDDPSLPLRVALAGPAKAEKEFKAALDNWLESKSFHGVEKIVAGLRYVGVQMDESNLPPDWRKSLNAFTDQRHKIVHRGIKPAVTRDKAQACTDLIEAIASAINRVAVKLHH